MSRSKWKCLDCSVDTGKIGEHYFINTETWLSVVGSIKGMLCIGCLETRLKRKLTKKDFTKCFLNKHSPGGRSERLSKIILKNS